MLRISTTKKTAHVGKITKIILCIGIVLELPDTYKLITEDGIKPIRAKPYGLIARCDP